jgi:plasmid stabilization system protein ParE
MNYDIFLHDAAKSEIKEALNYYFNISKQVAIHFSYEIDRAIEILKLNPKFEIRYKDYRVLQIGSFPYLFHFIVNETDKRVEIYGLRLTHRDHKTSWL